MCVYKNHAFIYFMRPPPWYGTISIGITLFSVWSREIIALSGGALFIKYIRFSNTDPRQQRFLLLLWTSVEDTVVTVQSRYLMRHVVRCIGGRVAWQNLADLHYLTFTHSIKSGVYHSFSGLIFSNKNHITLSLAFRRIQGYAPPPKSHNFY